MSCTNLRCVFVPKYGGKVRFLSEDTTIGDTLSGRVTYIPCGHCISCRIARRTELTLLQMAEASLYDNNYFLTLTYDDEKYFQSEGIYPYSLVKSHIYDFNKCLRKAFAYKKCDYRFFGVGEYGSKFERPHYHISLFGVSPHILAIDDYGDDLRKYNLNAGKLTKYVKSSVDDNGEFFWRSPLISKFWKYGSHRLYRANHATYQYVAGYAVKKLTGKLAKDFENTGRIKPFFFQSRPSIGYPWFLFFHDKLSLPDGQRLINDSFSVGHKSFKIPRIFDKWLYSLDMFDADLVSNNLKKFRSINQSELVDRNELKRKADFANYRQCAFNYNNWHKEV